MKFKMFCICIALTCRKMNTPTIVCRLCFSNIPTVWSDDWIRPTIHLGSWAARMATPIVCWRDLVRPGVRRRQRYWVARTVCTFDGRRMRSMRKQTMQTMRTMMMWSMPPKTICCCWSSADALAVADGLTMFHWWALLSCWLRTEKEKESECVWEK